MDDGQRKQLTERLIRTISSIADNRSVSEAQLSAAAGRSSAWFNGLKARNGTPDAIDFNLMCKRLDIDPATLLQLMDTEDGSSGTNWTTRIQAMRRRHGFDAPDTLKIHQEYITSNGDLKKLEPYMPFIELFEYPDTKRQMPRPVHMGELSLTALSFHLRTHDHLIDFFNAVPPHVRENVVADHAEVINTQTATIVDKQVSVTSVPGLTTEVDYIRLLLPVKRNTGKKLVLNYSRVTRSAEILTSEIAKFDGSTSADKIFHIMNRR